MSIATLCFCTLHNKRHLRGSIVSGVCLPAVLVPAFMTLLLVLLTVETAQMYHIHDPDAGITWSWPGPTWSWSTNEKLNWHYRIICWITLLKILSAFFFVCSFFTMTWHRTDHTRQGLLHIENGSMEQGLRSFRAAVRFTPSAGSYSNLVCLILM